MNPPSPSTDSPQSIHRWTLALLVTASLLFLAYVFRYVLIPFVVAGGLAFVATPLVNRLQHRLRWPRWAAAMAPFLLILCVLAGLGCGIKIYAIPQVAGLLRDGHSTLEHFLATLLQGKAVTVNGQSYCAREMTEAAFSNIRFSPANIVPAASLAFGLIMGLILTLVLLIYFMIEGPRLARGMIWLVPPNLRPHAANVARRAGPMIFSYVRGMIVIDLYATALTFIVVRYLLHLPHALVLAVVVGFLELVPFLGPVLSIALIALVAVNQMTFWGIIGVALYATALRVTIDQFVGPIVLGKSVRLPPPVIIFAFIAGGAVWGVLGIIVAIPAAAMIKMILEEVYGEPRLEDRS